MAAALNSDHVNYLVWRYLQEQGYGRAAIQLSRDWNNPNPQVLPFAEHVGNHSLVLMLQDALAYDQLIGSARQTQDHTIEQDEQPAVDPEHLSKRWNFVTVTQRRQAEKLSEHRRVSVAENAEPKRKKQRRETSDGHRAVVDRRKVSKPADQATDASADNMELEEEGQQDQSMQEATAVVPLKEEPPAPPPPPHTLEIGTSIGVQSDPIVDKTIAGTFAQSTIPGAQILRVEWRTPEKLLVSGGDVCHNVQLEHRSQSQRPDTDPSEITTEDNVAIEMSAELTLSKADDVATFAVGQWDRAPSGDKVAAAIEQIFECGRMDGRLSIFQDGQEIALAMTPNVVLALKWDTSSQKLLAIWDSHFGDQSFINVWDAKDAQPSGRIASRKLVREAVWLNETSFACCGENVLSVYAIEDEMVQHQKDIETDRSWEELHHDAVTGKIVCTSQNDGEMGLLDTREQVLQTKSAHDDTITGVQWQPMSNTGQDIGDDEPRLLATSCTDGTIKLWNARQALECIYTFTSEPLTPVWTVKFASDGSKLAAVMDDEVRVWEAKVDGKLIAKWKRPEQDQETGQATSENQDALGRAESTSNANANANTSGEAVEEAGEEADQEPVPPSYALTWDQADEKLALTHGSHIWIIKLPEATNAKEETEHVPEQRDHEMT